MKNFNKIMQSIFIFKGVIKPKIFLILFTFFFSTLAFAATLSVTWKSRHMGGNPDFIGLTCYAHPNSEHPDPEIISADGAQDPTDIAFSNDGLTYFTANQTMQGGYDVTMYKLTIPFDLSTLRNDCSQNRFDLGLMADDNGAGGAKGRNDGSVWGKLYDMEFSPSGHKVFLVNGPSYLMQFSLSTAFDLTTAKFDTFQNLAPNYGSVAFNRDGTKMFWLEGGGSDTADATKVETYDLGSPFDITSLTLVHTLDLSSTALNSADGNQFSVDMNFNDTGSAFYILINDPQDEDLVEAGEDPRSAIYQFSLEKNYDMSTASLLGSVVIIPGGRTYGVLEGFEFGDGGMKLYVIDARGGTGVDQTNVYQLECPYGVVACVSDPNASISSQVELAKQNISLNVDTIFKRFEWIKRNRDNEELSSHNININYPNPLLRSLASKFEPSLKNNLATFVSNTKKKGKKKKSKWSSWSIAEISVGNYDETLLDNPKDIYTKGLTFGSDRKIGDNKFFGLALRYGNSESDIRRSVQEVDLESLTLNIYGVVPTSNTQYINAVLGLSALRFDNKYLEAISGERNGKQAFASINYRTKSAYSKFNITPTGKLTYGVTQLSEFTDFISNTIDAETTDVRYKEDTFRSGEFAGGLLFEMEKYESDQGSLQPMGGIEIIYDLTDDITYKYQNVGATAVNKETIKGKYSRQNLKTNIGFEAIHTNGFTVSTDYQRTIRLNDKSAAPTFTTERFIIKFSNSKEDNTQFALDFDPLKRNFANLSYAKDIGNFNLKFNSNYSSINRISDYGANIELSGTF